MPIIMVISVSMAAVSSAVSAFRRTNVIPLFEEDGNETREEEKATSGHLSGGNTDAGNYTRCMSGRHIPTYVH
jgi:hypothetical protein